MNTLEQQAEAALLLRDVREWEGRALYYNNAPALILTEQELLGILKTYIERLEEAEEEAGVVMFWPGPLQRIKMTAEGQLLYRTPTLGDYAMEASNSVTGGQDF